MTQTKKTGTVSATRKGGLGKSAGKPVKRFAAGTMKPGRSSPEGDSKIKGKPLLTENDKQFNDRSRST